jgi:uncharacterized membrane protein
MGAGVAVLVVALCIALGVRPITAALIGWDAGVLVFFAATIKLVAGSDPADIRRRAARQDVGQFVVLTLSAVAGLASVVAIYAEVSGARGAPSSLILGVGTIVLSWFFVHAMFALHYAHEYYDPVHGDPPGLKFPGKDTEPDYWDFFYVALVIGMSAQVSDVDVTGRRVRRTVLVQGIVAFWFNAAVLALLINIAADAIGG